MDDLSFRSPRPRRRCDASTQIMLLSLRVPRGLLTGGVGLLLVMSIGCSKRAVSRRPSVPVPSAATQRLAPAQSTFFSTAAEESYSTYQLAGDGDLWPSCWADDDNLYTANGDGKAFNGGSRLYDMAVFALTGVIAGYASRRARVTYSALLAGLSVLVAWLFLWSKILHHRSSEHHE